MEETRDRREAWSEDVQAPRDVETGDELPSTPLNFGHGVPADERFDVLAPMEGADIVDLGCGGGQSCVLFARRGAGSVTGVDVSRGQVHHARRLRGTDGVDARFLAGDVTALPIADDSFDLAFSSWVFQLVDELERCFAEAARVLRADGALVFAVPHPYYTPVAPGTREPERDRDDGPPVRASGSDGDADAATSPRAIGGIHRTLVDAGFEVERVLTLGTGAPDASGEQLPRDPELMVMVPPTLVVRAVVA